MTTEHDNYPRVGRFRRWLAAWLLRKDAADGKALHAQLQFAEETGPAFARGLGVWGKCHHEVKTKWPDRLYFLLEEECEELKVDRSTQLRNIACLYYTGRTYDEVMLDKEVQEVERRAAVRAGKGLFGALRGAPNSQEAH